MFSNKLWFFGTWLFLLFSCTGEALPPPQEKNLPELWQEVENLQDKQQYSKAQQKVRKILQRVEGTEQTREWSRALIRHSLLERTLHGYEGAVRILQDKPWPSDTLSQSLLHLFYAHTLFDYYQNYSWEINQREKVTQAQEQDLKKLTSYQIFDLINKHYHHSFQNREALGELHVKDFPNYIRRHGYPEHIRATLRDFLCYQWIEFLFNTSTWRPEQEAEKYKLDFELLLALPSQRKDRPKPDLLASDTHPIDKAVYVLDDLYFWHQQHDRPETTLESQITRLQHLARNLNSRYDKDIIAAYQKLLPQYKEHPWWAMGRFHLATVVNKTDPVQACKLAMEAYEQYPDSLGGQKCHYLAESIKKPSLTIRTMKIDRLQARSIEVTYKNLDKLYFRAYPISASYFLEQRQTSFGRFPYRSLKAIVKQNDYLVAWEEKLEDPGDYQNHQAYVTPPLKKNGIYLIAASAEENFTTSRAEGNHIEATTMVFSDIVPVTTREDNNWNVWVVTGKEGEPVADAEVMLYQHRYNKVPQKIASQQTDVTGRVTFSLAKNQQNFHVVVKKDDSITLDPNATYLRYPHYSQIDSGAFIYTDRSIYRPLQKVYYKVLAYQAVKGKSDAFEVAVREQVKIELRDPNNELIASQQATTNEYGSVSGEFVIPKGRVLGRYSLRVISGQAHTYSGIQVEEYKRPTFEVELQDPKQTLVLNRQVTVQGNAKYYFGLPVTEGEVFYRVIRQPRYPWWYSFYYGNQGSSQDYEIASGFASVDKQGHFTIPFTPEADESLPNKEAVYYNFKVSVDFTAPGGETRSSEKSYVIGFTAIEAKFSNGKGFVAKGKAAKWTVVRQDLNGVPRSGKGSYQLHRLEQPEKTLLPYQLPLQKQGDNLTPGDKLRPRWESPKSLEEYLFTFENGEQIAEGQLEHQQDGQAQLEIPALSAGAYRVTYQSQDATGNTYQTQKEFVVAGNSTVKAPLFLLIEQNHLQVGEQADIFFGSGLPGQTVYLEFFQSGDLLERVKLERTANIQRLLFNIQERHRGGLTVRARMVHDYQFYQVSQTVSVPWDNKHLDVSFETFRDLLKPGQQETWTVKVKGPNAQAASAEILAYMYDRSLDFFVSHNPPSVASLYPTKYGAGPLQHPLASQGMSTVFSRNWYTLPKNIYLGSDQFIIFDNYPVGGPGRRHRAVRLLGGEGAAEFDDGVPAPQAEAAPMESTKEAQQANAKAAVAKKPQQQQQQPASEDVQVRKNFNETAFFQPHLITNDQGEVEIKFTVPESVTEWKVYLHAVSKDLKFMTLQEKVVTRKDLMVRPYLPRFLREGDKAVLEVVINNATAKTMPGKATLDILDPETKESHLKTFAVTKTEQSFDLPANGSTTLTWQLKAPNRLGSYAFRVIAQTDHLSDGEQRAIPVLPSRIHLSQSKFITLTEEEQTRIMELRDLQQANDDPTLVHNSLVVKVQGQLIYSVLKALPYLVEYPYECTEQTLNRFISTGIVTSLFDQYPALAQAAEKFSQRDTRWESWNQQDPNRQMALTETPWLEVAKGQTPGEKQPLINILDARIAKAQRELALEQLAKAQYDDGSFPWWPGGPGSPYMTLYVLAGFGKAQQFEVEIPKQMVKKAWNYLATHFKENYEGKMPEEEYGYNFLTYLSYVLSCYPEAMYSHAFSQQEKAQMLEYSFKHWKELSPGMKALLTLSLHRANRQQDAKLVLASIMDSAITREDQGTFWAKEDRSWLWYNDTIESHAFILRTLAQVTPEDKKHIDGLVLWLLLNKKMNQWKSTRATAEVLYSLAQVMKDSGSLVSKQTAQIALGQQTHRVTFNPKDYDKATKQIVVPGQKVTPKMGKVQVAKSGKGPMFASMNWHYSTEKLPPEARGDFLTVKREYFLREHKGKEYVLHPLEEGAQLEVGDEVEVHLSIRSKHPMEYVHLQDPRGAGLEPQQHTSGHKWNLGIYWYEEIRDSATNFFFEHLPQGEFRFTYRLRANMAGSFRVGPATLKGMYAPEFAAFSAGKMLRIDSSE